MITKEKVLDALKEVIYFPKANNIVALDMVSEITVEGNRVSFSLLFDDPKAKNAEIVEKGCTEALKKHFGTAIEITGIERKAKVARPFERIKYIVAVASGKGGVGKSTIAVNLAVSLSQMGQRVGIFDADIYGPSLPLMFDIVGERPYTEKRNGKDIIIPIEKYGMKVMTIGFFVDPDQALIWRGPMASNALKQLLFDTDWGELDYLVVDLPPGTGDIHLTLVQEVPVTGVAIVSTPQEVALADARKAFSMFNSEKIKVPVLGLIENMSWFTPAELPQNKYYIFGKEGGIRLARESGIPMLGQIPLVQSICESGDTGKPVALAQDNHPVKTAFSQLAENVIRRVESLK
ncbi:MAG: MRP family ATP-binding protein [Sphingobacteriia bacterium]|nr:MRP family ATP-binding protein [Sphingobacteriia bacterium]